MGQFSRARMILGNAGIQKLKGIHVAIFGLGGVGGYVCEGLARSGIEKFSLIDPDRVELSNLNRQIIATHSSIGKYKAEAFKDRIIDINPDAYVRVWKRFFLPDNSSEFPFEEWDYIVDAVDTVSAKIELVMKADEYGIPIISSMGTGNKLDGQMLRVCDIYDTKVCPLARVMRRELKKRGIKKLKVVSSTEEPITNYDLNVYASDNSDFQTQTDTSYNPDFQTDAVGIDLGLRKGKLRNRPVPGSLVFVPAIAGFLMAGEVIRDICYEK